MVRAVARLGRPLARGRRRQTLLYGAPFLLYSVLRVPSFLEPHWYTDEAGYATTARALLQGKRLYAEIWNNKPPLHLWTVAADIAAFGSSEAGLHVVTFLSGLATLAAVLHMGPALLGRGRTVLALSVVAVLLGAPLFDAELAIPESLLIAPATWAAAIVLRRMAGTGAGEGLRWPLVAGVLAAAAIAYQQTAVADAAAFGLILALSPQVRARQVGVYAGSVAGVTVLWVAAMVLSAGASTVGFALGGFYVAYTQAMLPATSSGLLTHALLLLLALVLIVGGALAARRSAAAQWAPWIWAGATLLVPAAAQQPYAHFLAPAVVPVTVAIAGLRAPAWRSRRQVLGRAALLAGVLVAALMARIAGVDWVPALAGEGTNAARDVAGYYGGALGVLLRGGDLEGWQDSFDARVAGDRAVARWVKSHGLSTETAVVWSSDAWPYLMTGLSVLMPTAPIYNDEVLLGNQGQVAVQVGSLNPDLIITSDDSLAGFPEVQPLLSKSYRVVDREGWDTVWLRDDDTLTRAVSG